MKVYKSFILLMLLVLVACETKIPYKGEYTEPMLVLHSNIFTDSNRIEVFPSHSYFFMDSALQYNNADSRLLDAVVEYKYNNNDWQALDNTNYPYVAYLNDVCFLPGDSIKLRAAHKDYQAVESATEIFPQKVNFQIEYIKQDTDWVYWRITIDPYQNPEPVVLALSGKAIFEIIDRHIPWHYEITEDGTEVFVYDVDSVVSDTTYMTNTQLLSLSPIFASMPNQQTMSTGYFNSSVYLFFDVQSVVSQTTLEIRMPQYGARYSDTETYWMDTRCVKMECAIQAMTMNTYKYHRSTIQHLRYDPNYRDDNYDLGAYLSEMTDFGMQEDVQVFTNIINGLGCMAVSSCNKQYVEIDEHEYY